MVNQGLHKNLYVFLAYWLSMEYRTVSTKLPSNEATLFRVHCERKGVTPANLLRDLILKELKITIPNTLSGVSVVNYNHIKDTFTWSVKLDSGVSIEVLKDISPFFVEDLFESLRLSVEQRNTFIHKLSKNSVPIPANLFGERKKIE